MMKRSVVLLFFWITILFVYSYPIGIVVRTGSSGGYPELPGVSIEAYIDGDTLYFSTDIYSGDIYVSVADANNIERIAGLYDVEEGEEYEIDLSGLWESDYTITFTLDDGTEYEGTFHY